MDPLHDRLAALRESVKLTRQAFALRIGIDQSTYSRYELGQTKPSLDTLEKISITFPTIDARWLLTGKGEMHSPPELPADPAPVTPTAGPLRVVPETDQVKELKEQVRELREHNRLLRDLLRSGVDLSKVQAAAGSFSPSMQEAAEPPVWMKIAA